MQTTTRCTIGNQWLYYICSYAFRVQTIDKKCARAPNQRELCLNTCVNDDEYLDFMGMCDDNSRLLKASSETTNDESTVRTGTDVAHSTQKIRSNINIKLMDVKLHIYKLILERRMAVFLSNIYFLESALSMPVSCKKRMLSCIIYTI